jgi:hypothetical protein
MKDAFIVLNIFNIYSFIYLLEIYFIKLFFFSNIKCNTSQWDDFEFFHFFVEEEEGRRLARGDFLLLF